MKQIRSKFLLLNLGLLFICHAIDCMEYAQMDPIEVVYEAKTIRTISAHPKTKVTKNVADQFWQTTAAYQDSFEKFVNQKVDTGRSIASWIPSPLTSAINLGLGAFGSEYTLDPVELKSLDRYFKNSEKKQQYLDHVIVDKELLKEIFDEFQKKENKNFKSLKGILTDKTLARIPEIDDEQTRQEIDEDTYFKILTTTMFATHLYDQSFHLQ